MFKLPDVFTDECVFVRVCGRLPDGHFGELLHCDFDLGEKLHWFPLRTDGKTNSTWTGQFSPYGVIYEYKLMSRWHAEKRFAAVRPSGQSGIAVEFVATATGNTLFG